MSRVRSRDTKPEMRVRRLLHAMGCRYRLHAKDLPGRPDIVFRSRRKVIFVHGCFWHDHECKQGRRLPRTRTQFWKDKKAANKKRDHVVTESLETDGWRIMVVWECETRDDTLADRLQTFLEN